MDEPGARDAQGGKQDTEGQLWHDSIHMKCPEIGKYIETESRLEVAELRAGSGERR